MPKRVFRCIFLLAPFLHPWLAAACQCEAALSPCSEAKASELIFIGTVESIEPSFLNRWNVSQRQSMGSLNSAFDDALKNQSAASLAKLKDTYLKLFPDLVADQRQRFQAAKTPYDLSRIFFSTLDRGERVRFKVKTLFKHEDDDDAPPPAAKPKPPAPTRAAKKNAPKKGPAKSKAAKDDDDDDDQPANQAEKEKLESVIIETAAGDCGVDFQVGETYLVYANSDEGSGAFSTSSCTRTRRLSDAGHDLPYLSFYKDNPKLATQLEGFVTNNDHPGHDFDFQQYKEAIGLPVPGVVVKLESDTLVRYAEAEAGGRFVFDGLPEGDYRTTVYTGEYPLNVQLLAGPQGQRIAAQGCATQILWVPK